MPEEEEEEEERKGPPVLPILMAIAGAFVLVALIFVAIVLFQLFFPDKKQGKEGIIPTFKGLDLRRTDLQQSRVDRPL